MLPRGAIFISGVAAISTNTNARADPTLNPDGSVTQTEEAVAAPLKDSYGLYNDLAEYTCAKLEPLVQSQCGKIELYNVEEKSGEQNFRLFSEMRGKILYIDPKN